MKLFSLEISKASSSVIDSKQACVNQTTVLSEISNRKDDLIQLAHFTDAKTSIELTLAVYPSNMVKTYLVYDYKSMLLSRT